MKKNLLIMAAAFCVAGVHAQSLPVVKVSAVTDFKMAAASEVAAPQKAEKINLAAYRHSLMSVAPASTTVPAKGPRKSVANGVYYNRPAGTMYQHFSAEGMGYYPTILRFPAYLDVPFVDSSANSNASNWLLNTSDMSNYVDQDGCHWLQEPLADGYTYPILTLQNGKNSYQLSEDGLYYKQGYTTRMTSTIEVTPMGVNDDHAAEAEYYGWSGRNEKHYLFGCGEYTGEEDGARYKIYGVQTEYEKPISPLYVESIDISCYSFTMGKPIPEGKSLTMTIINTETNEEIATLTCSSDDFSYTDYNGEPYAFDTDYGTLYDGNLHFSSKSVDAFGSEVEEPVVLDCAYTVVVTGLDEEGVDVGFGAYKNYEPDVTEPTYNLDRNLETGDVGSWCYQTPFNIGITLNGLFDSVLNYGDVEATDGNTYPTYYVKIADDGTSSANAVFGDIAGALVYVGTPWFTEEGDEMYGASLPEWIQGMSATAYGEEEEGTVQSAWTINFTADPLPSGVVGRGAFVYIEGRGVTIDTPIFVFQGDIEAGWNDAIASGIEFVTTSPMALNNGKAYNMAGQIVNSNFKGLVIEGGKKYIKK